MTNIFQFPNKSMKSINPNEPPNEAREQKNLVLRIAKTPKWF